MIRARRLGKFLKKPKRPKITKNYQGGVDRNDRYGESFGLSMAK